MKSEFHLIPASFPWNHSSFVFCAGSYYYYILYYFRKHVHALQFHESWVIIYHLYHVSLCKWTSFDLSIYHVSCSLSFICVLPQCSAAAEVWYAHIVTAKLLSCDSAQSGSLIWWPLVQELTLSSKWSSVNVCFICYIIYMYITYWYNYIYNYIYIYDILIYYILIYLIYYIVSICI